MTGGINWIMVAVSFASLIGLGFGGLLVSQAQAREQKSKRRMDDLVSPYRRSYHARTEVFRPAPKISKSLADSVSSVFGFHLSAGDQYPIQWWIVLGVTFVVSRILAGFIVDVAGSLGLISWPIVWVTMCRCFFGQVVGYRRKLLFKQFPDALAMIVRSARVGIPVLGAIATVAREAQPPTSLEFTKFANELAVGIPLDEAVTAMGERTGLAEYRFFAIAIGLQARAGGALSETLENLADVIRRRLALKERGRALSSEARTSAAILAALPVACGGGIWAINPGYMSVLLTTSAGRAILGSAVLSLCFAAVVMQIIIKKSFVMIPTWILTTTGLGTMLLFAMAFALLQLGLRQQHMAARIEISRGRLPLAPSTRLDMVKGAWSWAMAALGQMILHAGILSTHTLAELEVTLASSRLHGRRGLEIFIGSKIGLFVGLPLLAVVALRGIHIPYLLTIAIPAVAAIAGLLLPDIVVRNRRTTYLKAVERGLPDALDLLLICAQAGLGLTAAIVRVADEMREGAQAVGVEFGLTAHELQLLDTRRALLNLGSRTGIDGLVRLANTLLQSMQYGTPLADAMRVLSAEMRQDTLTRFEARAARLGVLLTVPMMIFILPCLFLIVAGPAAVQVLNLGNH